MFGYTPQADTPPSKPPGRHPRAVVDLVNFRCQHFHCAQSRRTRIGTQFSKTIIHLADMPLGRYPPRQTPPPPAVTRPRPILRDTLNKRVVRILVECILVTRLRLLFTLHSRMGCALIIAIAVAIPITPEKHRVQT